MIEQKNRRYYKPKNYFEKKYGRNIFGFSRRQIKYRANRMLGMSRYDAALAAGYRMSSAENVGYRLDKKFGDEMRHQLDQAGGTDRVIASRIVEKFDAKKTIGASIFVNKDGTLIRAEDEGAIEVDDNQAQIKALELACKLKGHLKPETLIQQNEQVNFTLVIPKEDNDDNEKDRTHEKTSESISAAH